jgi:hypothetical protein
MLSTTWIALDPLYRRRIRGSNNFCLTQKVVKVTLHPSTCKNGNDANSVCLHKRNCHNISLVVVDRSDHPTCHANLCRLQLARRPWCSARLSARGTLRVHHVSNGAHHARGSFLIPRMTACIWCWCHKQDIIKLLIAPLDSREPFDNPHEGIEGCTSR